MCPTSPRGTGKSPLLERMRAALAVRHYSPKTAEAYVTWVRRFVVFHERQHPLSMGAAEVSAFLSHLAVERSVSASTQNQALAALLFLYAGVLDRPLEPLGSLVRAKRPARIPIVMSSAEVRAVLAELEGVWHLMASLLYGSGLRLLECVTLRVKDIDFGNGQVLVRRGKGHKDRSTLLPHALVGALRDHLLRVRERYDSDRKEETAGVELPSALSAKYPNAAREWAWQWAFPATRRYIDQSTGEQRRHHIHETALQRAVRAAASTAGLSKPVSCHTFRHSFATKLLMQGGDLRSVQILLGHSNISTTQIYTHISDQRIKELHSKVFSKTETKPQKGFEV